MVASGIAMLGGCIVGALLMGVFMNWALDRDWPFLKILGVWIGFWTFISLPLIWVY